MKFVWFIFLLKPFKAAKIINPYKEKKNVICVNKIATYSNKTFA